MLSNVAGRALSGAFTIDQAHRSLLVRIKECVDSTCTSFTGTAPACSSDRFSIRPSALTLSTTSSMASASEPTATASQTIEAGADFTLFAKTSPAGGYAGMLKLDASKLTAQSPSDAGSAQSGGAVGELTPLMLMANAAAIMASYSEAGYLHISPGAYRDDDFSSVDKLLGDCLTSTANNDYLADTLIGGKYGCSIGNKLTLRMGRFVPHHFSTEIVEDTVKLKNAVKPCPAGLICPPGLNSGFVYSSEPFAITVTARSLSGMRLFNYRDLLARNVTLEAWSAPGAQESGQQNPLTAPASVASHGTLSYLPVMAAAFIEGLASASVTYAFPVRYPAPMLVAPTDIHLRATEIAGDGVTSKLAATPLVSPEAGIKLVSGRLHLANNYGSELLAVPIAVRVQYWDGKRFVSSLTDQKTSLRSLDVKRANCKKNMSLNGNCMVLSITPASPVMVNGMTSLLLGAPGAGKSGSVDLSTNLPDWLPSTTSRIGLGIYKTGPVIYMREIY